MNEIEWLTYGRLHGWVSEPVCATHDGVPSTPSELDEWEDGFDPCQHVLRLWPAEHVADLAAEQARQAGVVELELNLDQRTSAQSSQK